MPAFTLYKVFQPLVVNHNVHFLHVKFSYIYVDKIMMQPCISNELQSLDHVTRTTLSQWSFLDFNKRLAVGCKLHWVGSIRISSKLHWTQKLWLGTGSTLAI